MSNPCDLPFNRCKLTTTGYDCPLHGTAAHYRRRQDAQVVRQTQMRDIELRVPFASVVDLNPGRETVGGDRINWWAGVDLREVDIRGDDGRWFFLQIAGGRSRHPIHAIEHALTRAFEWSGREDLTVSVFDRWGALTCVVKGDPAAFQNVRRVGDYSPDDVNAAMATIEQERYRNAHRIDYAGLREQRREAMALMQLDEPIEEQMANG